MSLLENTVVTFVIPIRHQDNARDWAVVKRNLTQTLASIAAQTDKRWRAVVVANHGADLPVLPRQAEVLRVDFSPNPHHDQGALGVEEFRDFFRIDKGRRVLAGMLHARATRYFMIVDDDDLVRNDIVQFVAQHDGHNGWEVKSGYVWSSGGSLLYRHDNFSGICGTCLIVRSDLYGLPERMEDASPAYVMQMLGSHIRISGILSARGTPLAKLPFEGAVYRVGHVGAHSKSQSILRTYLLNSQILSQPRQFLRNMLRLRMKSPRMSAAYFGGL